MSEDEKRFEEIYDRTKETVYRHITAKCFSLDDIDDIFQNTYAAVYTAICRRTEPIADEQAFVMLICKRQLMKYYSAVRRLRERFAGSLEDRNDVQDSSFSVEDSVIDNEVVEEIRQLLKKKPLTVQKAFFMHYRRGMTIEETAEALGISSSLVKQHIYRTLDEIKRRYAKEETK